MKYTPTEIKRQYPNSRDCGVRVLRDVVAPCSTTDEGLSIRKNPKKSQKIIKNQKNQ